MMSGDSGHGGGSNQDFDLNLAPIIDCFTVLITFMLVSASFLALGIFDAGAGAAGIAQASIKPPAITLEVELLSTHEIQIKISGRASIHKKIAPKAGDWDTDALVAEVQGARKRWPDTQSLTLSAANEVEYQNLIRVMDATRPAIPAILLGGF